VAQNPGSVGARFPAFRPDPGNAGVDRQAVRFHLVLIGVQIFQLVKKDLLYPSYPPWPVSRMFPWPCICWSLRATAESFIYFQF